MLHLPSGEKLKHKLEKVNVMSYTGKCCKRCIHYKSKHAGFETCGTRPCYIYISCEFCSMVKCICFKPESPTD